MKTFDEIRESLEKYEQIVINDKEKVFGKPKVLHLLDLIAQDLEIR